jgi:hypothetical protein
MYPGGPGQRQVHAGAVCAFAHARPVINAVQIVYQLGVIFFIFNPLLNNIILIPNFFCKSDLFRRASATVPLCHATCTGATRATTVARIVDQS